MINIAASPRCALGFKLLNAIFPRFLGIGRTNCGGSLETARSAISGERRELGSGLSTKGERRDAGKLVEKILRAGSKKLLA
ncbi:hypothetical protein [Bradyrhizobium sp. CCGUVB23]|uniref:hypothetical protein n=1 Tax=Bradyrhizobium sp. CCGUVB23 TaxID=2949630 RepID=UPI0020B4186A|nr:hypothetical protein [Bradyrhizobium sp. CCGUVB23]MCP3461007.1 hypothetical protein [Bradyrhizobium sp. CCGUVB23]